MTTSRFIELRSLEGVEGGLEDPLDDDEEVLLEDEEGTALSLTPAPSFSSSPGTLSTARKEPIPATCSSILFSWERIERIPL